MVCSSGDQFRERTRINNESRESYSSCATEFFSSTTVYDSSSLIPNVRAEDREFHRRVFGSPILEAFFETACTGNGESDESWSRLYHGISSKRRQETRWNVLGNCEWSYMGRALIMQRVHRVLWIKVSRDMTDRRASTFVSHFRTRSRQPGIIALPAVQMGHSGKWTCHEAECCLERTIIKLATAHRCLKTV